MYDQAENSYSIMGDHKFRDQVSGVVVDQFNRSRIADEITKLSDQDGSLLKALDEINRVREFIGSPENILGSDKTKHGEIAEHVEVGVHRAKQAFEHKTMTATFDGVHRLAPEDYLIDGIAVQSKFINGANNNLNAVIEHMKKYSEFGRDGSYYHIPKDTYTIIEKIRDDKSVEGLKFNTIQSIREKIALIESQSGHPFHDVVKPGVSKYPEVQQGTVHKTLNNYEEDFNRKNSQKKEDIIQDHKPGFNDAAKVAVVAGAVGAAVSLTSSLHEKYKSGKRFYKGEFTVEDWQDVGITTAKGGATGAISGVSIYALTNYASLSAPFAGAVVSATKGVASLIKDFDNGTINGEEFRELGMIICSEAAIVGIATAAGQAAIPIPVLGAVIGSIAGSMFATFLGSKNRKTAYAIRSEIDDYLKMLDKKYQKLVKEITSDFERLGNLTDAAFNSINNEKTLELSILLANTYGVPDSEIIYSNSELDRFMLE
jgi:hypothetical protein